MLIRVFKLLSTAKTFIYSVKEQCFLIGATVFRPCTLEEEQYYLRYWEEIRRLKDLCYTLCADDVKELVSVVNTILALDNQEYNSHKSKEANRQLLEMLETCSNTELDSLVQQKKLFIEALDYVDGAFYRHSSIENEKGSFNE